MTDIVNDWPASELGPDMNHLFDFSDGKQII